MADNFVQLPDDTPNQGKKIRTRNQTVGGNDVHTHIFAIAVDAAASGSDSLVSNSNPLPVSDAGGSLTVDGIVTVQDGGNVISVDDAGGSLTVDGSVTVSGSVTANAGTNLNTSALALESGGNLATIAATVYTDDTSTHSTGVSKGLLLMAVATPTDTVVDVNDIGAVAMTTARELKIDITTISGSAPSTAGKLDIKGTDGDVFVRQTTSTNLNARVDNNGTFAVQDSQVIADNAGFTDGTSKVFMAGFAFDEVAGTALTENDAAVARIDSKRAQVCVIEDTTTRGQRATVTASNALKVDGSAVTQPVSQATASSLNAQVVGSVASGASDGGNPVKIGGKANTVESPPASVTAGQRVDAYYDLEGRAVVAAVGGQAHDAAEDADNKPIKLGHKAIAHGTNPTAVSANDITNWFANRAGVPWVIGGHPNVQTAELVLTTARTDTAIVTVATGLKIVVTKVDATCAAANTVAAGIRIGFGTANVPTKPADGATVAGMVLSHPGIAPGSGVVIGNGAGIIGVGADNEDLRCTNDVPTGGSMRVLVSYYTIES